MLASGIMLAMLVITITEWLTIGTEKPHRIVWWALIAVTPMLAGMLFSKIRSHHHKKT